MRQVNHEVVESADPYPIFVMEKWSRNAHGGSWSFLVAFGGQLGEMQARMWLRKPHKAKARYRCRELSGGKEVTDHLLLPVPRGT